MKKKFFLILIILLIVNFAFRVYSYKDNYLIKYNATYWQNRFLKSQWVANPTCVRTDPHINPNTCTWDDAWYAAHKHDLQPLNPNNSIGDDGLYTYAGWEYITGHDPTIINAETPPFGKYLIGLSIILFGNQSIFAILCGVVALISFFILNKIIFKDNLLAILPICIFSLDPLFYTQLQAPYLDLLYLSLLLLTLIFVLKENYLFANIFFGLMAATKNSLATFLLVAPAIIIYLLFTKHYQQLKKFLIFLPISLISFTLVYTKYFLLGHNLRQFLGVQKYILNFYANGAKGDPSAVWQILVVGRWPNWFGPVQHVPEWSIIWPVAAIGCLYYFFIVFSKRKLYKSMLLAIWVIIYLIFLSIVPVWPRYLLLVLPFMYNLCVWVLSKNMPSILRRFA